MPDPKAARRVSAYSRWLLTCPDCGREGPRQGEAEVRPGVECACWNCGARLLPEAELTTEAARREASYRAQLADVDKGPYRCNFCGAPTDDAVCAACDARGVYLWDADHR